MNVEAALGAVQQQEKSLILDKFDENVAFKLGQTAVDLASARGQAIWVNISRADHTLFEFSMPGTKPANSDFGMRKRSVVNLMHFSSINFYIQKLNGFNFVEFMNLDSRKFGTYGGSFPIRVINAGVVGSITVSGLSDLDDHNLVVDVLSKHIGKPAELLELS